jgi:hypothetical protein
MRTEYWNLSTNTVRSGTTAHIESLTDVENYLLPQAQVSASSLYTWGVADGLTVSAVPTQPGVTIAPGVALDAAGHLIALAANGFAIVDPTVDPNQVQNIPTVRVDPTGVVLSTAGLSGACFLTLTWREVLDPSQPANAPVLLHAPWLRLLGVAGFQDTGDQVILARVTLDNNGLVTGLSVDGRRLVGLPASRLELRRPRAVPAPPLSVEHLPTAELRARTDGGLELNLLPPNGPPWPALTIGAAAGSLALAPQGGNVGIGTAAPVAGLEINRGATSDLALRLVSSGPNWGSGVQLSNTAVGGKTYGTYAGSDGKWHFADQDNRVDRLVIDQSGNVGIGNNTPQEKLDVNGRIKSGALSIGPWPANSNYLFFGVNTLDQRQAGNYALLQGSGAEAGRTFLNSPVEISFRINNADQLVLNPSGLFGAAKGPGNAQLRIAVGRTPSTQWVQYNPSGIYVDVDISAAGFAQPPYVFTSIGGVSSHWLVRGSSSVYDVTSTRFRVYINFDSAITPAQAASWAWHINWLAIGQ